MASSSNDGSESRTVNPTPTVGAVDNKGGKKSSGQRSSSERGAGTNSKKNPGKRPSQGGSSR